MIYTACLPVQVSGSILIFLNRAFFTPIISYFTTEDPRTYAGNRVEVRPEEKSTAIEESKPGFIELTLSRIALKIGRFSFAEV